MSLEQLLDLKVTSVSRKEQQISRSAAAIFVITKDDIRRNGFTSIPEALRLAPGLHVARVNNDVWAISARGFNGQYSNKLLVMIDGRSVYNPLFSGVLWNLQDPLIDTVERIEVVRGPGPVSWGANAMNGVINIITRSAEATQGGFLTATTGNIERASGGMQYGWKSGQRSYSRVSARAGAQSGYSVRPWIESRRSGQAGMRSDIELSDRDHLTIQADFQRNHDLSLFQTLNRSTSDLMTASSDFLAASGNLLAKWRRNHLDGSTSTFQMYFDRLDVDTPTLTFVTNTLDFDLQHAARTVRSHSLNVGVGGRLIADRTQNGVVELRPDSRIFGLGFLSAFDDWQLRADKLYLSAGARLEQNITGVAVQPTARLLFMPTPRVSIWSAISRAVRTPSRIDRDVFFETRGPTVNGLPLFVTHQGSRSLNPETAVVFESGLHGQVGQRLSVDTAFFLGRYDDMIDSIGGPIGFAASPSPRLVLASTNRNEPEYRSAGLELNGTYNVTSEFRLTGSYSFLSLSQLGSFAKKTSNSYPRHQSQVHAHYDLTSTWSLNASLYNVGPLSGFEAFTSLPASVPSYNRADLRVARKISEGGQISFGIQNLLDPSHSEFLQEPTRPTVEVRRSYFCRLIWWF